MIRRNETHVDSALLKYKIHNLFKNILIQTQNINRKTDVTKLINPDEFDKQNMKYFDVKGYLDFLQKNDKKKFKAKAGKSTNANLKKKSWRQ